MKNFQNFQNVQEFMKLNYLQHIRKLHSYFEKNHHAKNSGLNLLVYRFDNKLNLDNWYTNSADYNTF